MQKIPFADRAPDKKEFERLRLILSTFQDGTGQQSVPGGLTLPGWRDFERSVALVFGGIAQESKAIFDVLIPDPRHSGVFFGISCKMRSEYNTMRRRGYLTLELSNAAGEFWRELAKHNLNQSNYKQNPALVGQLVTSLVEGWHDAVSHRYDGNVDLARSYFLALQWNRQGTYELFQVALPLPDPTKLHWSVSAKEVNGVVELGRSVRGRHGDNIILEWYAESGGQLKYYPRVEDVLWRSGPFTLEPIPPHITEHGVLAKAALYYPDIWQSLS